MRRVDDFRLRFGKQELVPIMIGGMGVDISTAELALEAARLGGIGHISDAMVQTVSDRRFNTKFVKEKLKQYKSNVANTDKSDVQFDLGRLAEATRNARRPDHGGQARRRHDLRQLHGKAHHERAARDAARAPDRRARRRHRRHHADRRPAPRLVRADRGPSALSRCQARHHRLVAARAAAVPAQERAARTACPTTSWSKGRSPAATWASAWTGRKYDLRTIVAEILRYLQAEQLDIPLIPAGGIFTGSDARGLPRERRGRGAGGDALHRDAGMRPAGQGQAGIFQGQRGGHRGQHDLADRLPDAHAEGQPGDRRRHPAQLRGLRLPARRHGQLRLHRRLQPRGGARTRRRRRSR